MSHSNAQNPGLGDQGELWFASQLPRGWVWQPPRRDVGKDGLIVVRDDSDLQNVEFAVQIKSTATPVGGGRNVTIKNVSRSSVLYWCASTHPTLLVVVSVTTRRAWYAWHFDVVDTRPEALGSLPPQITLKIPTTNVLNEDAWDEIRNELKRCYNYLWNSTSKSYSFVFIVASVNILSTLARNMLTVMATEAPKPPDSEQDAVTLLIEESHHRNVLAVANKAHRALPSTAKLHQDIGRWIQEYDAVVRRSFPHVDADALHVSIEIGNQLAVIPNAIPECRTRSLFLIFDLIALLTKIHPSGTHNAP